MQVDRYSLTEELSSNPSVSVHRGRDDWTGRSVVIRRGPWSELEGECRLLEGLAHPGIVELLDAGRLADDPSQAFLVFADVPGRQLGEAGVLEDEGVLYEVLVQAALALDALHRNGWIHADLKPANVLVERGEAVRVTLIDFGLAGRVGDAGPARGTPRYASPAVLAGASPTPEGDLYALGASLLDVCEGSIPGRDRPRGAWRRIPPLLQPLLQRLVEVDDDLRFPTARGLVRALLELDPQAFASRKRPWIRTDIRPTAAVDSQLQSWLRRALAHPGHPEAPVLCVQGEPGTGRAGLLRELARRARAQGVAVLASEDPLALRARLLARAGARGPNQRPCLVLAYDVPDALRLRAAWTDVPALLAFTTGPGSDELGDPGLEWTELGVRRSAELEAAMRACTGALAGAAPLTRAIARRTDGHPGWSLEAAAALVACDHRGEEPELEALLDASLPVALTRKAEALIEASSPAGRELALGLALLRRATTADELEQVFGPPIVTELDVLRGLGILVSQAEPAGGLRLASEALARTLVAGSTDAERRRLHARIAHHLARVEGELLAPELFAHAFAGDCLELVSGLDAAVLEAALSGASAREGLAWLEALLARSEGEGRASDPHSAARAEDPGTDPTGLRRARLFELRGRAFESTGCPTEARADYGTAVRLGGPGLRLRTRVAACLEASGRTEEACATLVAALADGPPGGELDEALAAHALLGRIHAKRGQTVESARAFQAGLELLGGASHPAAANLWNDLGGLAYLACDYPRAMELHGKALAQREASGDVDGKARSLTNLGSIALVCGRLAEGRRYYEDALSYKQEVGGSTSVAVTLSNLGQLEAWAGDFGRAIESQTKALELANSRGDSGVEVLARVQLAHVWLQKGFPSRALQQAVGAVRTGEAVGERDAILSSAWHVLGEARNHLGQPDEARIAATRAQRIAREVESPSDEALARALLVRCRRVDDDGSSVLEELDGALATLRSVGERLHLADVLLVAAELACDAGRVEAARRALDEVETSIRLDETPPMAARHLRLAGLVAARSGDPSTASDALHRSKELAEAHGLVEQCWSVYAALGELHASAGRTERGLFWLRKCLGVFRTVVDGIGEAGLEKSYLDEPRRAAVLARLSGLVRS